MPVPPNRSVASITRNAVSRTKGRLAAITKTNTEIFEVLKHEFKSTPITTPPGEIRSKLNVLQSNQNIELATRDYGLDRLTFYVWRLARQGVFDVNYGPDETYTDVIVRVANNPESARRRESGQPQFKISDFVSLTNASCRDVEDSPDKMIANTASAKDDIQPDKIVDSHQAQSPMLVDGYVETTNSKTIDLVDAVLKTHHVNDDHLVEAQAVENDINEDQDVSSDDPSYMAPAQAQDSIVTDRNSSVLAGDFSDSQPHQEQSSATLEGGGENPEPPRNASFKPTPDGPWESVKLPDMMKVESISSLDLPFDLSRLRILYSYETLDSTSMLESPGSSDNPHQSLDRIGPAEPWECIKPFDMTETVNTGEPDASLDVQHMEARRVAEIQSIRKQSSPQRCLKLFGKVTMT